jgi:hypothetical protein
LQAQDLIVTDSGDSINCKITKVTKDYVHFTFKYNEEIRNTLLPASQITTQQKDYFSEPELPASHTYKVVFPHFRIAVDGGWQYRTAKIANGLDAGMQEHYQKMKSGFHYDIQAAYFFLENQGFELMFSSQLFGTTSNGYLTDDGGTIIASGKVNEKITFNYIGANYLLRLLDSKKKNCWLFSFGLGYMGYNDRVLFNNAETTKITASTVGCNLTVGYDIGLSENFGIGFKFSLMTGTFRDYKLTADGITTDKTMPEKTSEGLGTIKLSVGLRFNK